MLRSRPPHRPAFSLIELMVLLGIISILFGLVLSAIQQVWGTVNRVRCAHNLHQLGTAALMYQQDHGRFPPACFMPYAEAGKQRPGITDASGIPPAEIVNDSAARKDSDPKQPFGPNWAVYLLPYVGEEALYARANVGDYLAGYNSGNAAQRDRWRAAVQNETVAAYRCPADGGVDTPFVGYQNAPGPWARGNYAANAGPGWWSTSYDGGYYTEAYGLTGPVMGINYGAGVSDIPDGFSRTVLFTEVRAGVNAQDPRGVWALGFPASSVTAAAAVGDCTAPNDSNDNADQILGCKNFWYAGIGTRDHMGCSRGIANLGWYSWQGQARSRHRGGVNACFADGRVQFVSNYVYQSVWFAMLSARDGVPYATEDY